VGIAQNYIGSTGDGSEIEAYIANSSVDAAGDLVLQAAGDQDISSVVAVVSIALGISSNVGVGVSGSGVFTENKIGTDVTAHIDGDLAIGDGETNGIKARSINLTASDTSSISAVAASASVAAGFGVGATGIGVSIGVALAQNTITGMVAAYITGADDGVKSTLGDIFLSATENSSITAVSAAASIAAGMSATVGVGISGAGAESKNVILTDTNAFISGSEVWSAGDVTITATNTTDIEAKVITATAGVGIGGVVGVGASIGISLARNFIGWEADDDITATYATSDTELRDLTEGDTVRIASGVRAGDVYEYIGEDREGVNLSLEDYGNPDLWKHINLTQSAAEVQAYVENSSINAGGNLSQTATSDQEIDALVFAGSAAISGGAITGVSVSGVGSGVGNRVATRVRAFIDGDGGSGIHASDISLTATDTSSITATAGAASVDAAFSGIAAVSVSIGAGVAVNEISNDVEAFIMNADTQLPGNLTLKAEDTSTISSTVVAATVTISGGLAGAAISLGIAIAENTIANDGERYRVRGRQHERARY